MPTKPRSGRSMVAGMANSFDAEFDDAAFTAFHDAGLADVATYTAQLSAPVSVRCMLTPGDQQMGDFGQVVVGDDTALLHSDDVHTPVPGAALVIGSETWKLDKRQGKSGLYWVWSVRRV